MKYGKDKTIHQTKHLDIETDKDGNVVAVWFRCLMLPFKITKVGDRRAEEMKRAYESNLIGDLIEVEVTN